MTRRTVIGIVILLAAIVVGWMLLQPMGRQDDGPPPPDADFGSIVTIGDARVALPATAGDPAGVLFDITNRGERTIFLSDVVVQHGGRAQLTDLSHPDPKPLDTVEIEPGQTLRFGPEAGRAVLIDYDENVVPGAEVAVEFTFGNGESLSVPATVDAARQEVGSEEG